MVDSYPPRSTSIHISATINPMKLANLFSVLALTFLAAGTLAVSAHAAAASGGFTFKADDHSGASGEPSDLYDNAAGEKEVTMQLKPKKDKTFLVRIYSCEPTAWDDKGEPTDWKCEQVGTAEYTAKDKPGFSVPAGGKATVEDVDTGSTGGGDANAPQGDINFG